MKGKRRGGSSGKGEKEVSRRDSRGGNTTAILGGLTSYSEETTLLKGDRKKHQKSERTRKRRGTEG